MSSAGTLLPSAEWPERSPTRGARSRVDAVLLIACSVATVVCAFLVPCSWWVANLLFYGVPFAFLFVVNARVRRLHFGYLALFALFSICVFASLARRSGAWDVPVRSSRTLPGSVAVAEIAWIACYFLFVIALYCKFWGDTSAGVSRSAKAFLLVMFWSGMVLTLAPVSHLPLARLAYLKLGLVLYVSTISAAVVVRPRVAAALFWIGVMTAPLNLAFEVLALRRGYWSFAGHYVGWVTVFGATFPVEELVVLVLLSGPAVAANYSLFLESRTIFWRWPGRSHAFPHEASRPPSP